MDLLPPRSVRAIGLIEASIETASGCFRQRRSRPVRMSGTVYCHKTMRISHSKLGFRRGRRAPSATAFGSDRRGRHRGSEPSRAESRSRSCYVHHASVPATPGQRHRGKTGGRVALRLGRRYSGRTACAVRRTRNGSAWRAKLRVIAEVRSRTKNQWFTSRKNPMRNRPLMR
jgi:hypothetical protein